jgi:hypothetical protein
MCCISSVIGIGFSGEDDHSLANIIQNTTMKFHNFRINTNFKAVALALLVTGGTSHAALIGHWTFDEDPIGNTGTAADSSGATVHDGILTTTLTNASVAGKIGKGFDFNKGGDHVAADLGGDFVTGAAPASIAYWMNPDDISGQAFVFAWGANSSGQNVRVSVESGGGGTELRYRHQGGFVGFDAAAMTINSGWHHVAAVVPIGAITVGDVIFYMDGAPLTVVTPDNDPLNVTGGNPLTIGSNFGGNTGFDGQLDDVGFWDHALSADDVKDIYNGGLAGQDLQQALIPEPSTAIMLLLGAFCLTSRRRQR